MYQYRIEKYRLPVTVRLIGGNTLVGTMFVQPTAFRHLRREEPIDVMNSPEPFFALETADGDVCLVPKDRVVEILGVSLSPEDEMRRDNARTAEVSLRLVDGVERPGMMLLEMPSDRPRVIDYFNQTHERFFTLFGPEQIHVINIRAIEHIRPLD